MRTPSSAASTDIGAISTTASGSSQLSYIAASTRKTKTTARPKAIGAVLPGDASPARRARSTRSRSPPAGASAAPPPSPRSPGRWRRRAAPRPAPRPPGRGCSAARGRDPRSRGRSRREPSGTIAPVIGAGAQPARCPRRVMRCCMSAWAVTRQVRPSRLKSLTKAEPSRRPSPRARARRARPASPRAARSISARICGVAVLNRLKAKAMPGRLVRRAPSPAAWRAPAPAGRGRRGPGSSA